ncbi:hypothetical protein Tco_0872787 [Tanacetum coccineum]
MKVLTSQKLVLTRKKLVLTDQMKPLPNIDPKEKGKKMIEEEDESDTDSEDITEAEKKFKQLARDEEVARKARLNADKILAEKHQGEKREMYTSEQRAKFLHDTIAAQRRYLAQQRSEAIKNKPPSRNQLRNQMMTYLKHVGGKKNSDMKTKGFEEIKALYDKIKRSDDSFIAIGSAEDEKVIKEMNEQVADASKKRVKKDSKRKFTSKDDEELRLCLTIVSDKDKEVDYEILNKKYPIKEWISEYLTTKLQSWTSQDQNIPELAIPEQTATGKGIPNPLMAGSLPKTIKPTELDVVVLLKRQVADEDG